MGVIRPEPLRSLLARGPIRAAGIIALIAALSVLAAGATAGDASASKEYQVKAGFLFNFARFVEWPPSAFAASDSPICIGIVGDDPFGRSLDDIVRGEEAHGRKLTVQRTDRIEDLVGCQIVFISRSEKDRVRNILERLEEKPVLTVSDIDAFANRGGAIRLGLDGNKVRFDINQAVVQQHGLKVSAQLLALGKLVATDPDAVRR